LHTPSRSALDLASLQNAPHTAPLPSLSDELHNQGKQLFGIFKEAKAAYKDKKDAVLAERGFGPAPVRGIQRAQTFDVSPRGGWQPQGQRGLNEDYYLEQEPRPRSRPQIEGQYSYGGITYDDDRRRFVDDVRSSGSSRRSHRSRRSSRQHSSGNARPPLTESNLRTLSEFSSTTSSIASRSQAPANYRSPYAESAPRDMALSRPTLGHAPTMPITPSHHGTELTLRSPPTTAAPTPRQSMLVHRVRSDPSLRARNLDMNLAYGSIPPDLASRTDLDVGPATSPAQREAEARTLMQRIEALLTEAQCVQHSATHIIKHLQNNPQAAAAVALTLAELSSLLGKMSPAFLGVVKGGFPAVFALLASPQFLVGVGVAVGVTVVMFGGWKIVKKLREGKKEEPIPMMPGAAGYQAGAAFAGAPESSFDEALVVEEDLSTIESWRRGIVPYGEEGSVDIELISPEAQRSMIERHREATEADGRTERSVRTERTKKSGKTHRSHHTSRTHKHRARSESEATEEIPERKSSRGFQEQERRIDGSRRSERTADEKSERGHRSKQTSTPKLPKRLAPKAIEGSRVSDNTIDTVLRPKEKKRDMLKQLFKKKERDDMVESGAPSTAPSRR
jgi:hypothetical protein